MIHTNAVQRRELGTVGNPWTDPWMPLRPVPDKEWFPCPGCEMMWDYA